MAEINIFEEANRQLIICNACRYCEGLCPVFPALELRRTFTTDDIRYLSNLCHDCRACQQACMYTEPHEFAMNFPKAMSEVRMESYEHWSWPGFLARSFSNTPRGIILGFLVAAAVFVAGFFLIPSDHLFAAHRGPGAFYQLVPYVIMIVPALFLFFFGMAIWLQGAIRFWTGSDSPTLQRPSSLNACVRALRDSLTLKYLGGGGAGCYYESDKPSSLRRVFHSFVFWGFLADLVSTTLAFIYQDFFHILPPYPILSAPVVFGIAGGMGLIIGTPGLIWFKIKSDRSQSAAKAYGMDYSFLIFLGLTGLTGMLTLLLRSTPAMGTMLIIHLGSVAALFATAPYGKFVHFVYRLLAMVRYQVESQNARPQGGH
jgi:citrate/tricarballylate utilization protein